MNSSPASEFDWRLVRSFLATLETGSLLGAARRLRGSQPTIGRHVAELERQLFTPPTFDEKPARPPPDWSHVHNFCYQQ